MSLRNIDAPPMAKEDEVHPPFPVTRRRSSNYIDALNVHKNEVDATNMNLQDAKHAITSREQKEHDKRNSNVNQANDIAIESHVVEDVEQTQRPANGRRRSSFDYENYKKHTYNKANLFE